VQQWSSFPVSTSSLHPGFPSINTRYCDSQTEEEYDCHYRKGKDPLESDNLGEELANAQASSEEGSSEANVVILKYQEEEASKDCNTPNGDVGNDMTWETMASNHDRPVPKNKEE